MAMNGSDPVNDMISAPSEAAPVPIDMQRFVPTHAGLSAAATLDGAHVSRPD
jgi:hypothetical protein